MALNFILYNESVIQIYLGILEPVADTGGGGGGGGAGGPPPPRDTQKKLLKLCTADPACIGCSDTENKL